MDFTNKPSSASTSNQTSSAAPSPSDEMPAETTPLWPESESREPTPTPIASRNNGKGGKTKKVLLGSFLALLLAGLVAYGTYAYFENNRLNSQLNAKTNELTAVTQEKQKLSSQKQQLESTVAANKTSLAAAVKSDDEQIKAAVSAYLRADIQSKPTDPVTLNIVKKNSSFARTSTGAAGAGGMSVILKKSENTWVVVFAGQDKPPAAVVSKYAIPAEFL